MHVSNRGCIRRLSFRVLCANRTRNLVAVLAIALTAMLFTSLFTIALSINEGIQQNTFRQIGSYSHGGFKYLTQEQFAQLRQDPLIQAWGVRRFLGMPAEPPFNKAHVEIGYSDANQAHWMYCDPVQGRLPQEGTNEAATDTRVLELLGLEPKLGAQFTMTFDVDGHSTTQTFTLCGWWEYDEAIAANHVFIPQSRLDEILSETGVTPPGEDGMTGAWNMDVMLRNGSRSIEADLNKILENHGYQSQAREDGGNYIDIGVNWGYTGAQLADKLDPVTVLLMAGILALILLTGYLIIYNVFQISVAGDIRFYGLLKTIGTTPRQLRRLVRMQAVMLSLAGIPLGLILGWLLGGILTPVIVRQLNAVTPVVSVSPAGFVLSAVFALVTVLISCRRPGRLAGKVSPVEAVRYTEAKAVKAKKTRAAKGVSLFSMAFANLGRSRGKTIVTIFSLSLAVVLLTATVTFTGSFDMDKYIANFTASDFIVADARQFQTGTEIFNTDMAVTQEVIDAVNAQGGIENSGRVYGKVSGAQEFVTEEYYRSLWSRWYTPEQLDSKVKSLERSEEGLLADGVQLYGMEPFALELYAKHPVCPGNFVDLSGAVLGQHRGIIHYTIGQRKGLGISFSKPHYVCAIDPASNTITLGKNADVHQRHLTADDFNWISGSAPCRPIRCKAKIRYGQAEQPATATALSDGTVKVLFDAPQRAVTPGQAVVLYDGDIVLGGGVISPHGNT